MVGYYKATGCTLTSVNLMWNVMEISEMQGKALNQKAKETTRNTPKLWKTTTVAKWSDKIKVHLSCVFGPRPCGLSYLIFLLVTVPVVANSLEINYPHSSELG